MYNVNHLLVSTQNILYGPLHSEYLPTEFTSIWILVLLQIVRIIANLSLNNSVGKQLTSSSLEKNASERILNVLLSCIRYKNIYESEEVLLVTLTTLNNLTFYTQTESQSDSPFSKRTLEIAQGKSCLSVF